MAFKRLKDGKVFDVLTAPPPPGSPPDEGPDNRVDNDVSDLWELQGGGRILVLKGRCILMRPGSRNKQVVEPGYSVAVAKFQPVGRTRGEIPEVLVLSKEELERDFVIEGVLSDVIRVARDKQIAEYDSV